MSFLVADDGDDGAQELLHMALAFVDSWVDDNDEAEAAADGLIDASDLLAELPSLIASCSPTSSAAPPSAVVDSSWDDVALTSEDDDGASSGLDARDELLEALEEEAAAATRAPATRVTAPLLLPPSSSAAPAKRSGRWTKSAAESVKRSRAKKKAEAVELRARLKELEAAYGELQRQKRARIEHESALQVRLQRRRNDDGSFELEVAEETLDASALVLGTQSTVAQQTRERLAALALNAKLKDAIGHHASLLQAFQAMLASPQTHHGRVQGLELLRDEQRQSLFSDLALATPTSELRALQMRVLQMNVQVEPVFAHGFWREHNDSVLSSSLVKLDPELGPLFELRANAPLLCGASMAGEIMWRRTLELNEVVRTPQYSMTRQQISASSFRKSYSLAFESPTGTMTLEGTSYFERFTAGGRFAYIWASDIVSLLGEKFRESGWVVAFPDARDATRSRSHFRVFYQISSDMSSSSGGDRGDGDDSRDAATQSQLKEHRLFVLKTLGIRTQVFQDFIQQILLDEFCDYHTPKPLLQAPWAATVSG